MGFQIINYNGNLIIKNYNINLVIMFDIIKRVCNSKNFITANNSNVNFRKSLFVVESAKRFKAKEIYLQNKDDDLI
jgi:hypothetical protein